MLRRGVAATAVLGVGLPAATGTATARENGELEAIASRSGLSKADSARARGGRRREHEDAAPRRPGLVESLRVVHHLEALRAHGPDPQTGKEIQIAARSVVRFKAGAELSKAVN